MVESWKAMESHGKTCWLKKKTFHSFFRKNLSRDIQGLSGRQGVGRPDHCYGAAVDLENCSWSCFRRRLQRVKRIATYRNMKRYEKSIKESPMSSKVYPFWMLWHCYSCSRRHGGDSLTDLLWPDRKTRSSAAEASPRGQDRSRNANTLGMGTIVSVLEQHYH